MSHSCSEQGTQGGDCEPPDSTISPPDGVPNSAGEFLAFPRAFLSTHTPSVAIYCIILLLIWLTHSLYVSRNRRLPPGPRGLPFIGSLLQLRGNILERLRQMATKYGGIFTIKLGMVRIFVLSEVDIIREAFVTNAAVFNDRPSFLRGMSGVGKDTGIVTLESGPFHRHQRALVAEILRTLGIGDFKCEVFFRQGITELCRELGLSDQRPIDAKTTISSHVLHTFATFLFGTECEEIHSFLRLRASPSEVFNQNPAFILASKVLPSCLVNRLIPDKAQLTKQFLNFLQKRRQQFENDPSSAPTAESFVDGILAIQRSFIVNEGSHPVDDNHSNMTSRAAAVLAPDAHYSQLLFDFFMVGAETSFVALLWVLQMLMFHPEWQSKIQDEIDRVVGPDETPSVLHKTKLHITMATITEVYRFRPTSALGAPHRVTRDTFLRGYFIPEGSIVMANIYAANNDCKFWRDPDTFNPGRFLDADGRFCMSQSMITFSAGPRSCPGKNWTRSMIFLFTTAILREFSLKFPEDEERPDMTGHPGINYSPHDFKISAVPRRLVSERKPNS